MQVLMQYKYTSEYLYKYKYTSEAYLRHICARNNFLYTRIFYVAVYR